MVRKHFEKEQESAVDAAVRRSAPIIYRHTNVVQRPPSVKHRWMDIDRGRSTRGAAGHPSLFALFLQNVSVNTA